jgi:hypothetical protein
LRFSASSRALRVHRAEVKTSPFGSIRLSVTVRADGRPSAAAVTKATAAGCGWSSARAPSIQLFSRTSGSTS